MTTSHDERQGLPWPGPVGRTDENLLVMTRAMLDCMKMWPKRASFYTAQADQFVAECERRGLSAKLSDA